MKEVLIFAGTTEGRKLSECLSAAGIAHRICVATEYGEMVLKGESWKVEGHTKVEGYTKVEGHTMSERQVNSEESVFVKVHQGRMNREEIKKYIQNGDFAAVVDATHPYADVITENIKAAMKEAEEKILPPYFRLKREIDTEEFYEKTTWFDTNEACAKALEEIQGNILLTTGSKELAKYCTSEKVRNRLYVRVLPSVESLNLCMEQGICGKQILAMQGPFSAELNEAVIRQYQIACLVTKASGKTGGYSEKLEAAKKAGIPVFVVGHSQKDEGYSFDEVCRELETICKKRISRSNLLEIVLAGIGMGSRNGFTKEVSDAIDAADILLGAERMLADFSPKREKRPYYQAEQIIPYLKEVQKKSLDLEKRKVVILFSGDSGFYSGCQSLYQALQKEIEAGHLQATLRIMPGISSVAYLASCIRVSYQDAAICSIHGKALPNLVRRIQREQKLFLLMSGAKDVNRLGNLLLEADMQECEITVGYQLSYPEQQIKVLTPESCCEVKEEGLYTCFIRNPKAKAKELTHGIADGEFIRDKVPMTKEEVREVSICKLKLYQNAVVYDIGSGTGSIAVEIAGLSDAVQVFALERKKEAVSLIEKNKEKFQLQNITVVTAEAPEGLLELPMPTHAFIGGSSGRMKEILSVLYQKNPKMRVVINAISMETICEIKEVLSQFPITGEEIVQLQVSRVKKAGAYHLMQAENPVWICAFDFSGGTQ